MAITVSTAELDGHISELKRVGKASPPSEQGNIDAAIRYLQRAKEYCTQNNKRLSDCLPECHVFVSRSQGKGTLNKARSAINSGLASISLVLKKERNQPENHLHRLQPTPSTADSKTHRTDPAESPFTSHHSDPFTTPATSSGAPPPQKSRLVSIIELGQYLRFYKDVLNVNDETLAGRIDDLRRAATDDDWFPPPDSALSEFEDGMIDETVELNRLSRFLRAYNDPRMPNDMPQLMAEWMVSTPVNGDCVHQALSAFQSAYGDDASHWLASKAQYAIPAQRLAGTDCAFVRFCLSPVPSAVLESTSPRPLQSINDANERRLSLVALDDMSLRDYVPSSTQHQHPGDEILFVLEGAVFVELDDTGTRTRLQRHDYMHFNAEIPHTVWNMSLEVPATVLVIRFFQLSRLGSRRRREDDLRRILRSLEMPMDSTLAGPSKGDPAGQGRHLAKMVTEAAERFDEIFARYMRIVSWLHSWLHIPRQRVDHEPEEILDYLALSNLLRLMILLDERDTAFPKPLLRRNMGREREAMTASDGYALGRALRALADRIAEKTDAVKKGITPGDLSRLLRGQRPVFSSIAALELFAEYFQMPRVLLDNALLPPVPRCVVVRDNDRDRIRPPKYVQPQHQGKKTSYRLPCRALANSDIAIFFLTLKPGGHTSVNRHMGFEFLLCLDGCVRLDMFHANQKESISCKQHEYLHYRSRVSHQVHNDGERLAQVLVIRFNEDDGAELESAPA